MSSARTADRGQTLGQELANAISHGLGFLLAVAMLPILVFNAAQHGGAAHVGAASMFAGTMIALYFVSMFYHALPRGRAKAWFNQLDHASIYLFIAGSYMPFLFGVLSGAWVMFDSKLRYAHFVWHLFVMGGSACHFFAARWHAAA